MKRSLFSTVVNDLIRSAAGKEARNVDDDDLEEHIANMIARDARAKVQKYEKVGLNALTSKPASPSLKPNTRFLKHIVKATDNHNKSVIRAAEERAKTFQEERSRKRRRSSIDSTDGSGTESIDNRTVKRKPLARGRGKTSEGSAMDKYFATSYDPSKDTHESESEAKKHKKKRSKKKRRSAHKK
ncbi:hypothetical protein DM01DRAFT_1300086 [Hesseltinella vesiculosa]|uniref:Uncharacterized protein n=1 Tax=Hesseltinella vesiculosa TaxID=101127 RepID=A0A1X2GS68_9FUNG|nr:hypothetical protein DM01DRAFT_1300086 [Hesseltinella vesiculosa]